MISIQCIYDSKPQIDVGSRARHQGVGVKKETPPPPSQILLSGGPLQNFPSKNHTYKIEKCIVYAQFSWRYTHLKSSNPL